MHATTYFPTIIRPAVEPDDETLRAIVARRLALKAGLSLAVASAVAAANGLGPQDRRARR